MIQAYSYERFRQRKKNDWLNFWCGDFHLLWPGLLTMQFRFNSLRFHNAWIWFRSSSNSIHLSLFCIRFNSKLTKNAELNWNWFGIWIDSYISAGNHLWNTTNLLLSMALTSLICKKKEYPQVYEVGGPSLQHFMKIFAFVSFEFLKTV